MGEQLSKVYEPKTTEGQANEIWFSGQYFHAEPSNGKETGRKPYTIVIPPPNVTAPLHLGHALNNTLQDILIRYHRMQNYNTLWMPGTDHAGIATQTVVEKRLLSEQGKRRTDFARGEFVAYVQAWKDEYEAQIIEQLKAMGCSCDWQRTRFTMDAVCAKAVRAAFFKLFKDGLIYRGKRLVNWDPATQTVLADDEVEYETVQGHFWYMRYPLVEPVSITAFQAVDKYSNEIKKRYDAYLPHWNRTGDTYAVTFRLEDSLPMEVFERLTRERDEMLKHAEQKDTEISEETRKEISRLYGEKVESYLDEGHGKCHLADGKIAGPVQAALKHFDGERYNLIAWAVMPNHVHTILKPCEGFDLPDILHSWKSYTANNANKMLGQTGTFWHVEHYDHLIRDEDDFYNQVNYVLNNPAKAGLEDWEWVGVNEDALIHGQDARVTYVTVATTRPETMLGDTAVAMNPGDRRAEYLLGKMVRLPIVGRIIPIIADEHVVLPDADSEDEKAKFSTGFLKVTPAHDPDDWEIGQRHNLDVINVMAPDGSISDKYGWEDAGPDAEFLLGMDRFEAREAIVEWFRKENLLEDVREYTHEVGHSYRSHVPIEPYLSDQWYIAVKKPIEHLAQKFGDGLIEGTDVPVNSLAGLALKPLLDGRLKFIPERYGKSYQAWLENLRDWPISRQLWWGHRIPIWYCQKCGQANTSLEDSTKCQKCNSNNLVQDPDVLDTWFSSALWPFSTMGWPDDTPELATFYPGDVLCTARDIITLWVSRMVMMGQYCVGDIPFGDVYIHAMIQDGQGRRMSKSLGNGIDPLVVINSHGADAMRFTLASMTTQTQDIRMPVVAMTLPDGRTENTSPKFDTGRNFCNKLWNASRFAMVNLEGIEPDKFDKDKMTITDKWILWRLSYTIGRATKSLSDYKFHEPLGLISRFFWNEFCDWYLEWIKPRMQNKQEKPIAQNVLAFVLDQILRLLHPFVPFITEGIFQKLNEIAPVRKLKGLAEAKESDAIIIAQWPKELNFTKGGDYNVEADITLIQKAARHIRNIKNQYNVPPSRKLNVLVNVSAKDTQPVIELFNRHKNLVCRLECLAEFEAKTGIEKPKTAAAGIDEDIQVYVYPVIDPEVERGRLEKQKDEIEKAKKAVEAKLNNENFVTRAKPQVVEQARGKLAELSEQLKTVEKHLSELE